MPEYYIGIMTGTSMDSIDVALVDMHTEPLQLIHTLRRPFPLDLKSTFIRLTSNKQIVLSELGNATTSLSKYYSEATLSILEQTNLTPEAICAVGIHGQTIAHAPNAASPFTWQCIDPSLHAVRTGIKTVSDFRRADIAAGGQGAPLAPAFHQSVFASSEKSRAIINIGGIANITLLYPDGSITGYDTGPGNCLMDQWCTEKLGQPYDKAGQWAQSGNIDHTLLKELLAHTYFSACTPKSAHTNHFGLNWLKTHLTDQGPEDVQATLAALTAITIADAIDEADEVYVCGGGVHNQHLIARINSHIAPNVVRSTQQLGIDPDWVEAIAFAWFAKQRCEHKPANIPSVTGAKRRVILGGLYE